MKFPFAPHADPEPFRLFLLPGELAAIPLEVWAREFPGAEIWRRSLTIGEPAEQIYWPLQWRVFYRKTRPTSAPEHDR